MKIVKDISTIGLGDIIGSGITAIFWFYLASILVPSEYGQIHYLISIAIITSTFTLLGTQNVLVVYIAKNKDVVFTLLILSIICGVIILIICAAFGMLNVGLLIVGIIIFTYGISRNLARKEFKKYSVYTITQKSLVVILSLIAYFVLDMGIDGIVYGVALSYFVYLKYVFQDTKNTKFSYEQFKIHISELRINRNFILTNYFYWITNSITNQVDKLIIVPILGLVLLGNYSLSLQIITVLSMPSGIIFKFLLPHTVHGKTSKNLKRNTVLLSFLFVFIGIVVTPLIIPIYFPEYNDVVGIVQIMSFSIIPITINLFYFAKFLAVENGKFPLYGGMISSSVMIVGMLILGSMFDAKGIAIAHLISHSSLCLFFYMIDKKTEK